MTFSAAKKANPYRRYAGPKPRLERLEIVRYCSGRPNKTLAADFVIDGMRAVQISASFPISLVTKGEGVLRGKQRLDST